MNKDIEQILVNGNLKYKWKIMENSEGLPSLEYIPKYPILIITCIDPRIDVNKIFQLNPGDVFVFRNAGNVFTDDMLRSILVAIVEFNIKYIIVLGHLDCGMAKINLKKFREKLPSKFLSQLSKNYSVVLTELNNFFKPFNNEVENVKRQIKSLSTIKSLYPEIEITGMVYDIKTGLIFEYDLFKDYKSFDNFEKLYKELIVKKKDQFTDFIISNKSKDKSSEKPNNVPQENKLIETEESSIQEKSKDNADSYTFKSEEYNKIEMKPIIPKISVPKIKFHKVKIYIPTTVRKKKNN